MIIAMVFYLIKLYFLRLTGIEFCRIRLFLKMAFGGSFSDFPFPRVVFFI